MGFKKGETKTEPKKETENIVKLTGKVHGVWMKENSAFALINVGLKNFVPCTLFGKDDEALAEKLDKFAQGDHIEIIGYVNAWAVKKDGEWQRKLDIRITEIRTDAPANKTRNDTPKGWAQSDDDIPF